MRPRKITFTQLVEQERKRKKLSVVRAILNAGKEEIEHEKLRREALAMMNCF